MQTQLGTIMDIYPTVLSVAGCEVPQNYVIDGFDLKKQLSGKVDKKRPESFLMHFPHAHRGSYFTTYRMGDWKLIYYYEDKSMELFNLKNDRMERNNLVNLQPTLAKELYTRLMKWLIDTRADIPTELNPAYIKAKKQ